MITHELSLPDDYDDYLARALQPASPLMILGRSARAVPACQPSEAVYHCWKDWFTDMHSHPDSNVLKHTYSYNYEEIITKT